MVALFLFDPRQTHSVRVRNNVVGVCTQGSQDIRCIALVTDERLLQTPEVIEFLRCSGFAASVATATLSAVLNLRHIPTLHVLDGKLGGKVSGAHEELGLEWNSVEQVADRWRKGRSSLTKCQQLRAAAAFPSCAIL